MLDISDMKKFAALYNILRRRCKLNLQQTYNKKYLNSPLKLHLGCGTHYKEDYWVNIDNNSDNNILKLDINCDFVDGIPFNNNSVDFIYHEHLIEHLTYEDGLAFMKECLRVLKPRAVMRIACPNLDDLIKSYLEDTWRELQWVKQYKFEWIPSRCYMINMCMNERPWGHKYVYNKEDLFARLKEAGFDKIEEVGVNTSSHKEFHNIDTRSDSMVFEASKG